MNVITVVTRACKAGKIKARGLSTNPPFQEKHQNWGEYVKELVQRTTCCLSLDAKWVYPVAERELIGLQRFEPGRYTWALQISHFYIGFFIILFRNCLDVIVPATAPGLQSLLDCRGLSTDSFLTWTSSSSGVGRASSGWASVPFGLKWQQVWLRLRVWFKWCSILPSFSSFWSFLQVRQSPRANYNLRKIILLFGTQKHVLKRVHWLYQICYKNVSSIETCWHAIYVNTMLQGSRIIMEIILNITQLNLT